MATAVVAMLVLMEALVVAALVMVVAERAHEEPKLG
jgi:hypothetical protein